MAQLVDDLVLDASAGVHRPRNLDWKRAAALLYGDWGTSKAYVIGLAFLAAAFSSLPIILAVCAVTGLVGINYIVICRHFPMVVVSTRRRVRRGELLRLSARCCLSRT